MSVTRTLMKKWGKGHSAWGAGLPMLPVDAGRGSVLRGTSSKLEMSLRRRLRHTYGAALFENKIKLV